MSHLWQAAAGQRLPLQTRKARTGFNPKTQQKIKIPAKTVVKFRVTQEGGKGRNSGGKKVIPPVAKKLI